jgi:hypothetical protein
MSDRDYYEILGLTPQADGAMVDQTYWHLARKYQTLGATTPNAQHLLDELNEAYTVIGNPRLREQYDAFRDDVLLRRGMLQPVKAREAGARRQDDAPAREIALPSLNIEHWRVYAVTVAICGLAFAGAWQGVNVVFVAGALVVGLAFALLPTVSRRVSEISLSMPTVSLPSVAPPKLTLPNLGEIATPALREIGIGQEKDEPMDADELRQSTAQTIARWRKSVGLRELPQAEIGEEPDSTLADIVQAEREIEEQSEPLAAVLDILRGSRASESRR